MKIISVLITLFCLLVTAQTVAQNITTKGQINTRHYSINEFGSAAQIWTGLQATNGNLLFGNRQDILSYNGLEWSKIKTDTEKTNKEVSENCAKTFVAKLYLASDDKVYVGRDNNFGYLNYSSKGELVYYPVFYGGIKNEIGKVWNVFELGDNSILFAAEKGIYIYKNKNATKLTLPSGFENLICKTSCRILNGFLFVYQNNTSFKNRHEKYLYYDLIANKIKEIKIPVGIEIKNIRGSFQLDNCWYIKDVMKTLVSVQQKRTGEIIWKNLEPSQFSSISKFFSNSVSKSGKFLINNTENEGLILGDLQGNIIREFNLNDELANLSVTHSFFDKNYNLWLCLGNGIQFFETGSPLTYFNKKEGVNSQTECIDFLSGKTFIGTHDGIVSPSIHNNRWFMKRTGGLNEIIFDIESIQTDKGKKTLIIGYNGIYEYDFNRDSTKSVTGLYAFAFEKNPKNKNSLFLLLENGLGLLELQKDNTWKYTSYVEDAGGETISLAYLNDKIYFSIRGKGLGIYNLKTKKFTKHQIPQLSHEDKNNNFFVEVFRDEIFVGTADGIFTFDENTSKFTKFAPENHLRVKGMKNTIHRMVNIDDEQLWVVIYQDENDEKFQNVTGWFEKHGNNWEWISWPLSGLKNAGLVYAIEKNPLENEVWIGANEGLYVLNLNAIRKNRNAYRVQFDRMEVNGKIFRYNVLEGKSFEGLAYSQNSFKFIFSTNSHSSIAPTNYSYKLEGFNDQWSQWSPLNFANFEKIPEGKYTLLVKAKSAYGIESEVLRYEITVFPPWYRTIYAYIFYFIALVFVVYFVSHLATQRVKIQNQKLEETVQERTKEIAEQNHQLEIQKEEIMAKTMDILDSIHYAKRIQTTILPNDSRLKELFNDYFVFYRPKDIVSGDFYWAKETEKTILFSAVDCTGHGVPGALVSIVGNNGLLRATNEFQLTEPSDILDKLREIVIAAFRAEGTSDVKDGMDIALCSIDKKTGLLKYAGANNDCIIIRNGEIIELKPDKQPIGQFIDAKPFTQKEFQLEEGDCVYMTTDGYVDQFGGDKMKKFKSKPFKALLSSIYHLEMDKQLEEIQSSFDNWKQDIEQVDDVCVFAVKYKKHHEN